jgi:tripartite-type tricarboxylate transporter receptor subunit TctC
LIVVGGAGSYPDTVARRIAEPLGADLGQQVNVFNMPGAAGALGMAAVMQSEADGHTVALVTMGSMVFNQYLYRKLQYEPLRDFVPLGTVLVGPMVVVAHPAAQVGTLQELVAAARSGKIDTRFAVPGIASPPTIVLQMMMGALATRFETVPFKTGSEALLSVTAGQPLFFIDSPSVVAPMVRSGRLKAIVVTGSDRVPLLPAIPTLAEAGFPDVPGTAWIGLAARVGTSETIVKRWNDAIARAVASANVQEFLTQDGSRGLTMSAESFRAMIIEDQQRWGKVIRESGLTVE